MKRLKFLLIAVAALLVHTAATAQSGHFGLPKYEKVTLKNGLTVYLMEQH